METEKIERHPLEPFFPEGARLLLMGSFPPKRERWKMDFYYPNFQNDMWRIIGLVFFDEKDYFLTEDKKSFCESRIRSFLIRKGIAVTDSGREVIRQKDNASDKFLEIVGTIDLSEVLKCLPECEAIVTTGQKATDTLLTMIEAQQPGVGQAVEFVHDGRKLRLYRMPSSSRAYPKPLSAKAEEYKKMFQEMGML
jgi:G:T/U-mismatch repair DNA glycosylase